METQPPPQAPDPYTVVHDAPKPASIKVFGILNIVFGALGLVSSGAGVIFFIFLRSTELGQEIYSTMDAQFSESHQIFLQFSSCFGGILSLILLAFGVGLLRERNWGRTGSLGYAAFQLLYTVAGTAMSMSMMKNDETFLLSAGGTMCGVLFSLIYPICILFFLTRPNVVEALKE